MNDLDHMLNGNSSRQHHQDMIRQAQQEKFARDVASAQGNEKSVLSVRALLIAVIHLIIG